MLRSRRELGLRDRLEGGLRQQQQRHRHRPTGDVLQARKGPHRAGFDPMTSLLKHKMSHWAGVVAQR